MSESSDSESFDTVPAALPPPVTPIPAPAPRPRTRAIWIVIVVLALAIAYLAYNLYWGLLVERGLVQGQLAGVQTSIQKSSQDDLVLREGLKTLETRLAEATATNRILREEVLAMNERASLLEDAVSRLADNRLRGEVMLRLNEAEFLLLLGEERLRLFGDVAATLQAYALADAALAGVDDPSLATLRQTLAQESVALREVPADPRATVRAELAQIVGTLPRLPASRSGEVKATDANDSRLVRLLSGLVTVRRVSERDAVLGPVQRETTLAALRLQLELAQAALARPDVAAFQQSIDAAGALVAQAFDGSDADVARLRERLTALRATALVPELPALGATLQELRGLRATRSVGGLDQTTLAPPSADPATRNAASNNAASNNAASANGASDDAAGDATGALPGASATGDAAQVPATAEDRDVEGGE